VIPACSSLLAPLDDAFAGLIYRGNFVDRWATQRFYRC
jgi:hypothetical protein